MSIVSEVGRGVAKGLSGKIVEPCGSLPLPWLLTIVVGVSTSSARGTHQTYIILAHAVGNIASSARPYHEE